jgi:ribosomal protein S18 acetylase RimI-like enzyme
VDFEIRRGGPNDIPRLEPLWHALRDHHVSLPDMLPARMPEESWGVRRGTYENWLAGSSHTLLLAERDGEPIGYAVVSLSTELPATWDVGDKVAEIETLSVLGSERGGGVGRALTDAAAGVAREQGAETVFVGVAHSNEGALRFYERAGFEPFYVLLVRG